MTFDLFAIERYDDSGGTLPLDALPTLPDGIRLACAVHLPADDALLAFVEGTDEQSVRDALTTAGWRFDRISTGVWVAPPATSSAAGSDTVGSAS